MKRIVFVFGGTKSGKSDYAVRSVKKIKGKVAFLATAVASDHEMKLRIKKHQQARPVLWKLVEEKEDIISALRHCAEIADVILVDCLGLWISNLLFKNMSNQQIEQEIDHLSQVVLELDRVIYFVSNEVGKSVVSDNLLSRRFVDLMGITNQVIARQADEVVLMHAGIAVILKERKD
ncbi:MAG: bifunctional adenosylcobinamide kinase/adenosylcobinamide-phosphate guanylyltransferase, partial [Candidatus Omnitrophota bacterium]